MEVKTFLAPSHYFEALVTKEKPWVISGTVCVHLYRYTCEQVPETHEVICQRLEELWTHSKNKHEITPLEVAAREFGYVYRGNWGENSQE